MPGIYSVHDAIIGVQSALGGRGGGGDAWWIVGGISPASVVCVYEPKGAVNLAGSYINLANPGTYDAAPVSAPSWDVNDGWVFDGSASYLVAGIDVVGGMSALVRFSGFPLTGNQIIFGSELVGSTRFGAGGTGGVWWMNYGDDQQGPGTRAASGVLAITPDGYYLDGSLLMSHSGSFVGTGSGIGIGCTAAGNYLAQVNVQSFVLCDVGLSAGDVSLLSAAMAAR